MTPPLTLYVDSGAKQPPHPTADIGGMLTSVVAMLTKMI
jgi:hypothetical protein